MGIYTPHFIASTPFKYVIRQTIKHNQNSHFWLFMWEIQGQANSNKRKKPEAWEVFIFYDILMCIIQLGGLWIAVTMANLAEWHAKPYNW